MNTNYQPPLQQYQPQEYGLIEEDYADSSSRNIGLIIGGGLALVAIIALVIVFFAARPAKVSAPSSYTTYYAPDGTFSIAQPVGWDTTPSSAGGIMQEVLFKNGTVKIKAGSDLEGSLMGDVANAQNAQLENLSSQAGVPVPPPTPPVEKVHMAGQQAMAEKYADYVEQPMQPITVQIGQARYSEFTANGGMFVGKIHGYRETVLSADRRITVIEVCPETNWSIMSGAFMSVMQSVGPGKAS